MRRLPITLALTSLLAAMSGPLVACTLTLDTPDPIKVSGSTQKADTGGGQVTDTPKLVLCDGTEPIGVLPKTSPPSQSTPGADGKEPLPYDGSIPYPSPPGSSSSGAIDGGAGKQPPPPPPAYPPGSSSSGSSGSTSPTPDCWIRGAGFAIARDCGTACTAIAKSAEEGAVCKSVVGACDGAGRCVVDNACVPKSSPPSPPGPMPSPAPTR